MTLRSALWLTGVCLAILLAHPMLVAAMAHGHVAHVLLASGSTTPPVGPAALAVTLVLVRLFAIVLAPGLLLAALVSLAAHLRSRVSPS